MVEATLDIDNSRNFRGKLRLFLSRFLALFSRLLHLKKYNKTASRKRRPARKSASSVDSAQTDSPEPATAWPPERLNVIEKLWGEGCTSPGSADFLRVTVPMLSLSEKTSLLLIGAGLGGIGRAMVEKTGVWVTGFEADAELVGLARHMTKMTGMQKRAPVSKANLEDAKFKEKSFNTVVSLESLYRVEAKEQLYTAMVAALRGGGELLMTDFVAAGDGPPSDVMNAWANREPTPPHLWTAKKIQSFLKTLNLDVRPNQDITAQYRAGIFKGFFKYLSNVTKPELLEISGDLIDECEYWAKQLSAIDCGQLKVFRFQAFKLPEKRKGGF